MLLHNLLIVGLIGCFVLCLPLCLSADEQAEKEALAEAQDWLEICDAGKYDECWRNAANFFKQAITCEKYSETMKSFRKPLGKLIKRSVKSKTYATSLPGAPDGEYVVIQFDTQFENKKTAIETVTPMKQKDGSWKVSGYYIK